MDTAEWLAALRDRLVRRFPRTARWLRRAYNITAWAAFPLLLINLLLIPDTRQALPVYLGIFTLAIQLGLLLRSRGVALASYLSMVVAAALWSPLIFAVQLAVMTAFGWTSHDDESSVWVAGPTEEVLKLAPLAAVLIFARNRAARFGIADHILLGAACGAGFGLAENVSRGLGGSGGPSLLSVLTTMEDGVGHTYSLFTLFPGWTSDTSIESSGHAVWTALLAGGIGIARRYGRVLWSPLVLALLGWVCLDHMAWNEQAGLLSAGLLPEPAQTLHAWLGSGFAARPALLAMILLAVWLDYRTLAKVHQGLPPIPGKIGTGSGPPPAFVLAILTELGLQWRMLRRAPLMYPQATAFVRARRELGYGLHRAAGHPRRDAPPLRLMWQTGARLHNAVAIGVALIITGAAVLAVMQGDPVAAHAFLAPQLESLADWWNGLSPGGQFLVTAGGVAGLMLIPGVGFMAAVGAATTATGVAASGRDIARAIRDKAPGALAAHLAIAVFVGRLRPATVVKVNGRWPINSQWAGKEYRDFRRYPQELYEKYGPVRFTDRGYPDFSPNARFTVDVPTTGKRSTDFRLANQAAGLPATPKGWTWHHVEDGRTMHLIPYELHDAVKHSGGIANSR
ncbi:HNH endonuclease [Nocardiopsis gilva]|uniref:HNH endonuclease n=1 Tax=Nocardiopsis gilva TaxID=280236 RepID=UPI00034D90DF|nr:HNH endonuclease [Nocardiopsis gilva]